MTTVVRVVQRYLDHETGHLGHGSRHLGHGSRRRRRRRRRRTGPAGMLVPFDVSME